ncbi:MAG: hypothetical protein Q9188_006601 [Gyalolechia gomerana]
MFKATGCADSLMSNRISYAFDLPGPSLNVDTACSFSLRAMFLACQSLRAGEASVAISGGFHINLTPDDFISFSMSKYIVLHFSAGPITLCSLLSENGKSMSFDHRATSGFGRGEGASCVVLKPLEAAMRDGDKVRAVIRNSGIIQDGKTVGVTMPNPDAQEALIRAVYRSAHLDPLETVLVECQGLAAALGAVFGRSANVKDPLYMGSVKSNIGHLEGASGVAAIIKVAMMLEKGFLLPNCDFQKPNPTIPLGKWAMKVLTKHILLPRRKPRRASVKNFGFGGSNAHFILERAPKPERFLPHNAVMAERAVYQERISEMIIPQAELGKSRRLIILSASSKASAKAQAKSLAHYPKHWPEVLYRSIFKALSPVSGDNVGKTRPYLQKLYDWMQHALELGEESSILLRSQSAFPPYTDNICLERASHLYGSTRELTCLMGENLPAILRKEIETLSLLLQGNLLKDYYSSQDCTKTSYEYAYHCIDLFANHNPALRVLEIGAGTGGATLPILESLGGQEGKKPRFLKYNYTDISSGFFDAAKERFKPWVSFVRDRILDIEKELIGQGFGDEKCDMINAANVLHPMTLLKSTMENAHRSLKAGGRLILIEETVPAIRRFPFAALPGWWLIKSSEQATGHTSD